jgi:4-amino-4-deoxy-L-arabinose transferase-like glycosyltransferase
MKHTHRRLADSLWMSVLLLYAMLNVAAAPFHGDESTILGMANDWFRLTNEGVSALYYQPKRLESLGRGAQELRVLNGTLAPFMYGAALHSVGLGAAALPGMWDWAADWWVNQYYGHMPRPDVLFIGRWASVLTLCLALACFFGAARRLLGRQPAYLALLILAFMPAVLLNGRRAVFEGVALLGAALIWLAAARLAAGKTRYGGWLLLGAACGVALAAKHTNLLLIAPTFGALLWLGRANFVRTLRGLALAAALMGALFLALNPAWWSDPLGVPREVLRMRSELLAIQTNAFGRNTTLGDRLVALVAFPFGAPQYFEDTNNAWQDWLAESIRSYENGAHGVAWYAAAPLVYALLLIGIFSLPKQRAAALISIPLFGMAAGLFLTNPLLWQRYYLPLSFPLALLAALGVARLSALLLSMRSPNAR